MNKKKIGLILLLGCLFMTGCVEEWLCQQDGKRIHSYQAQPRDDYRFQGWWTSGEGDLLLYKFYDMSIGKEVTFQPAHNSCSNSYWYTQDSIIYETWSGMGNSRDEVYYQFKGNDTLQTSRNQIQFGQRDDPKLEWWTWTRVKDQVMLDSLRQYENH